MLVYWSPYIFRLLNPVTDDFSAQDRAMLDSLVAQLGTPEGETREKLAAKKPFPFDPNQAELTELESLGFPAYLAKRLIKYRQSGGQFRARANLMRLYGMDSALYHRLYDYIDLPEATLVASTSFKPDKPNRYPYDKQKKTTEYMDPTGGIRAFDLNTAVAEELIQVRGIGSKRAEQILRYRNKLGGFVHPDQLYEIHYFDSSLIQELLKHSFIEASPQVLDINTASVDELKAHPYIGYRLAKVLVAYREQHGSFAQVDDLSKIKIVERDWLQKVKPYLHVGTTGSVAE
ncbi:MAG: helix-hairpin-helix domain-containing protein [Cytophagales bacterium]|nr:helix-hairpin-helix domain-containing protein [Cytophagales bacterium]